MAPNKRKMDKLDSLLLVLSPSIAILVGVVSALGERWLIPLLPIVIPAFIMPIDIGYIRGAIPDCSEERVRGWIYFTVGIILYIGLFIYYLIGETAVTIAPLIYGMFILLPSTFFVTFKLASSIGEKIFEISGQEIPYTLQKRIIFLKTLIPSMFLTLACYYFATSMDSILRKQTIELYIWVLIALLFIGFMYFEKKARG